MEKLMEENQSNRKFWVSLVISALSICFSIAAFINSCKQTQISQTTLDLNIPSKLNYSVIGNRLDGVSGFRIKNINTDYAVANINIKRQFRVYDPVRNEFKGGFFDNNSFFSRPVLNSLDSVKFIVDSNDIRRVGQMLKNINEICVIILDISYTSLPDKVNRNIVKYIFAEKIMGDVIFDDYTTMPKDEFKIFTKKIDTLYKYLKVEE